MSIIVLDNAKATAQQVVNLRAPNNARVTVRLGASLHVLGNVRATALLVVK